MIQIACPQCQAQLKAPDTMAGKRTKCPKCQTVVAIPGTPAAAAAKVDLTANWYLKTAEGSDYGPVPRSELNEWFQEGRITAECQLLKDGSDQWQWASEVYPTLDPAVAAAQARQQAAKSAAVKNSAVKAPAMKPAPPTGAAATGATPAAMQGRAILTPVDDLETLQPWSEPEADYGLAPLASVGAADLGAVSGQLAALPAMAQTASYSPVSVPNPLHPASPDAEPIHEETVSERVGMIMMSLTVAFLSFQMVEGWAIGFVVPKVLGFLLAFAVGVVGGALAGGRHFIPGAIGGAVGCIGALIAELMYLSGVDVAYKAIMAIVACIGAAPGYGLFHLLKFVQDSVLPRRT